MTGFKKLLSHFGTKSKIAEELGISAAAVGKWEDFRIPAERCRELEKLTGGTVTAEDMRPDLFTRTKL